MKGRCNWSDIEKDSLEFEILEFENAEEFWKFWARIVALSFAAGWIAWVLVGKYIFWHSDFESWLVDAIGGWIWLPALLWFWWMISDIFARDKI